MREIKFKARNANEPACWIYGYFAIQNGTCYIVNDEGKNLVIAGTECQYTGLKDKNGKIEVYEDDLLRDAQGNIGRVFFCNGAYAVNWHRKDGSWDTDSCICYGEVIGDIHSNPTLLEKQ